MERTDKLVGELHRTLLPMGEVVAVDYPEIDLTDVNQTRNLVRNIKPQVIVNAAAYTNVDQAETEGKIERWHRTMKNVVKLENYYSPEELKTAIARFVKYFNQERYHESLNNTTPADVYYGRAEEVKTRREKIKRRTLRERKRLHRLQSEGV